MTIDEAIRHCEEVAERYERMEDSHDDKLKEECLQCAADHRQLAKWLTELRDAREDNGWINVDDRLPEEYKTVLVYEKDYGVMIGELEKKFFDTQYFIARKSGMILRTTEVTHWQPLPDPPVNP